MSLNSAAIFELWIHFNFEARLLFGVVGGLMLSPDNSLDYHAMIVSLSPVFIVKLLQIGWNVK